MAFERFWPDNLEQGEADTPAPKAGELLVKVGAVSLNFRDKAIVDGIYEPQIATALGARVIATSSKDSNLEAMKQLGAVAGVNYRTTPQWSAQVLELTQGNGVDLLLDVAGGDGINQSIAATKAGGRIAQIGFLTGQTSNVNLMPMIFRQTTIRGIAVAPRSSFDRMNAFLNEHDIRPVIDRVYSFEQAREAYEHLARGAFGKVVIKVG